MRSTSIAIYATAALAAIVAYVITAFSRGTMPTNGHEWITFSVMGLATAVLASAIIGSLVVIASRKTNQATESE